MKFTTHIMMPVFFTPNDLTSAHTESQEAEVQFRLTEARCAIATLRNMFDVWLENGRKSIRLSRYRQTF